jgi:hypothetical protein
MKKFLLVFLIFYFFTRLCAAYNIQLDEQQISWIGARIFANECSSRNELLVQWNEGEDFLSLGIGHFIWYPGGRRGPFKESFPDFLKFAEIYGADIPAWLRQDTSQPCPWLTKEEFLSSREETRLKKLRDFLEQTKHLQTKFIIQRFKEDLAYMIESIPDYESQRNITRHIERLIATAKGTYALVDYSNFKGTGILPSERYNGKGWGLFQVLTEMRDERSAPDAVGEFAEAADRVLTQRVKNSPEGRNEQRWLAGWRNRIKTYTDN